MRVERDQDYRAGGWRVCLPASSAHSSKCPTRSGGGRNRQPHGMIGMPQTPEELLRVAARTLAHYDRNAQGYWEGTPDHDVRQSIEALLAAIDVPPPFTSGVVQDAISAPSRHSRIR